MAIRHFSRIVPLSPHNISKGYHALRGLNQYTEKLEEIESRRKFTSDPIIARNCPFRIGDPVIHTQSGKTI